MKITFLYLGGESLAIESLSAVLKKDGFQTSLVFDPGLFDDKQYLRIPSLRKIFRNLERFVDQVIKEKADLICFSVVTDMYGWVCEVARELKKRIAVPIILGGIHVSSVPEEVICHDFVDMVCLGEGEDALLELAQSLRKKENRTDIKNIWFKVNGRIIRNTVRPLKRDLDFLPFPDKELFSEKVNLRKGRYMIMTSRGCPHACTYCYNDVFKGLYQSEKRFFRQRSVHSVIEELELMKQRFDFTSVEFMDDLFAADTKWFLSFADEYIKKINLPYQCMVDSNVITYEKAALLKNSGCTRIKFGIQTINPDTRQRILNRYFEKQERIEHAFKICDQLRLDYSIDHMFGIPYETEQDYKDTALFYSRTKAQRINCYSLSYFPNTRISEIAFQANKITKDKLDLINKGQEKMYVLGSSLNQKELALYKSYRNYYALLPIIDRNLMIKMLDSKSFKLLRYIPKPIILFSEFFVAVKSKHLRGLDFTRYYMTHLLRSSRNILK